MEPILRFYQRDRLTGSPPVLDVLLLLVDSSTASWTRLLEEFVKSLTTQKRRLTRDEDDRVEESVSVRRRRSMLPSPQPTIHCTSKKHRQHQDQERTNGKKMEIILFDSPMKEGPPIVGAANQPIMKIR